MKKILFYINAINVGGAERVMTNLATQFSEEGYEVVLVTSFRAEGEYILGNKVKRLSIENEEIVQSRIKRNLTRIFKLRKICKLEKPDLLVSFMGEPNFRSVVATIGLPTKTIVSVRNDPNREYDGKLMRFVGKRILPLADGCVFQTEDAKAWFSKKMQDRGKVIYNAVKSDFYTTDHIPKKNVIVSCGRLQPQKNHKLLIDAVSVLKEKYSDIILKIYGEGKLESVLKEYIKEKKLQDNVFLEGQVENVPHALSEADIFVLTSDYEGMPNALLEAMAMGIPCISTNCPCGGPQILLDNNKNGLLFPVGDKDKLIDCLEKLICDEAEKKQLGLNAKLKAKEFSTEVIFEKWKDYFMEICRN